MNKLILLGLITFGLSSCYYDNGEELYPSTNCDTENLTYTNQIAPIILNNCSASGCHSSGGQPPLLTTYSEVSANLDRIRVRALVEKTMPTSGPLSSCAQEQLNQWIANGAPEN